MIPPPLQRATYDGRSRDHILPHSKAQPMQGGPESKFFPHLQCVAFDVAQGVTFNALQGPTYDGSPDNTSCPLKGASMGSNL